MNIELAKFLAADERPENTMIYPELYGFLFAVCTAPEMTMPSDWIPLIFNNEEAGYADEAEASMVMAGIMAVYNEVNDGVVAAEPGLPGWLEVFVPAMENFADEAPLTYWARGFFIGYDWLSEVWEHCLLPEMGEEFRACLMVLSFFSGRELAEAFAKESGETPVAVENLAEVAADRLEMAMASYAYMGRSIYLALLEQAQTPFAREAEKVGRNDPCPCGSGKKFKHCCLH
ncbi:MAG TPA: YecA family protein [Gammaproteobacteria bacterium]|nr:YecA family protein [Gammaproteobacteria bacterium]